MNPRKLLSLLFALLIFALPVRAETAPEAEAPASESAADSMFIPAIMSLMYNQSLPQLFGAAQGVNVTDLVDAMSVKSLGVTDGNLIYSTIDGKFVLVFDVADEYATAPRMKAISFYEPDKGREVPLYPFIATVASLSGDMDFFAWAVGEHESGLDLYPSETFTATYTVSSESITIIVVPAEK